MTSDGPDRRRARGRARRRGGWLADGRWGRGPTPCSETPPGRHALSTPLVAHRRWCAAVDHAPIVAICPALARGLRFGPGVGPAQEAAGTSLTSAPPRSVSTTSPTSSMPERADRAPRLEQRDRRLGRVEPGVDRPQRPGAVVGEQVGAPERRDRVAAVDDAADDRAAQRVRVLGDRHRHAGRVAARRRVVAVAPLPAPPAEVEAARVRPARRRPPPTRPGPRRRSTGRPSPGRRCRGTGCAGRSGGPRAGRRRGPTNGLSDGIAYGPSPASRTSIRSILPRICRGSTCPVLGIAAGAAVAEARSAASRRVEPDPAAVVVRVRLVGWVSRVRSLPGSSGRCCRPGASNAEIVVSPSRSE